jgi:hypothetical protein
MHLNGTSGVKLKTRVEFFDPGFLSMLRQGTAVSRPPN